MTLELVGHLGSAGEQEREVQRWTVPLTYDGRRAVLVGELAWRDPPAAWPWLGLALLLVLPGLIGLGRGDRSGLVRPAALVVGVVAAVNTIHLVDDLIAWPSHPLDDLFGVLHTSLFVGVGLGGAAWAWRVEPGRRLALGIASAGVLYHQGMVRGPMLPASGFPTVWPDPLIRLTVALALMQAVIVAIVLSVGQRREVTSRADHPASTTSRVASIPPSR